MEPAAPTPTPTASHAPPRLGGAIQLAVVLLVLAVGAYAVLVGGREVPDIVRSAGPFADAFDDDGVLQPAWELPVGDVEVVGGTADAVPAVVEDAPEAGLTGAVVAVRRHGLRPRRAAVTLAGGGDGAGLLVGYRSPSDFWAVVASPSSGDWQIVHVLEGAVRERFTTGPAPTAPGTRVEATVDARTISVSVAGAAPATVEAGDRIAAADGIVLLPGGDPTARWEDFEVSAP